MEAEVQGEKNKILFLIEYMKGLKRITISEIVIEELEIVHNELDFKIKY